MSVQKQHIKRPVHRVPARIAFALAGVFVVVGLAGAPAFYAFAAFSAFCGLIWTLGGGADGAKPGLSFDDARYRDSHNSRSNEPQLFGFDPTSKLVYGRPGDEWTQ